MSLPAHLFDQATALATADVRRPRQANLRRAVSAAYYGLFHLLTHEATCVLVGAGPSQTALRRALCRGFAHGPMAEACRSFGGGTLKASAAKGIGFGLAGTAPIDLVIRDVAATFVRLQERRHHADYDLAETFSRRNVLGLIEDARRQAEAFAALPLGDQKRFFLACLLAWREMAGRK